MQTSLRASESKTDLEKEDYDTTIRPAFDETAPSVVAKRGRWGKLLAKLEGGGVESRGLERVQEHERVKVNYLTSDFVALPRKLTLALGRSVPAGIHHISRPNADIYLSVTVAL